MKLLPGESSGVSSNPDLGRSPENSREPDMYTAVYASLYASCSYVRQELNVEAADILALTPPISYAVGAVRSQCSACLTA